MPKMTAVEAAVRVLEKEDVSVAFGVPPGSARGRLHRRIEGSLEKWRVASPRIC